MRTHWQQLILVLGIVASTAEALGGPTRLPPPGPLPAQPFAPRESMAPMPTLAGRKYWVRAAGVLSPVPGGTLGADISAGYQSKVVGVDFRATTASTRYESFYIEPNYADTADLSPYPGATSGSSEITRERDKSDLWSFTLFEPGVSVNAKLFPDSMPQFTQKSRFGMAFGTFTDKANALAFSALLMSVEAGFQYHFSNYRPWSIELAPAVRWGAIQSKIDATSQERRLPVLLFTVSAGLIYWF